MRGSLIRMYVIAFLAVCLNKISHAEDWTRFRGPNGTGRSDSAFNKPITEEDFLWKIELPGVGHSSPVIRAERVYVTSADKDAATRYVLCINAEDGKTIWEKQFASKTFKQHLDNSYASATPAVDELGVYVTWSTPDHYTVLALDHAGEGRWKQDLGPFVSQQGSGASPIVVGNILVVNADQEGPKSVVVGIDRKTGKIAWKIDRNPGNKTAMSTPCLFQPRNGPPQLILTNKATGITSVDPQDGTTNWEMADALPARTVGSPVVTENLIIGTCGEGSATRELVALRLQNGAPTIAYKLSKFPCYVPTALVKNGLMFLWGDSGTVTCVKTDTGEAVWSEKLGGAYYGSPVCAGDTLWCMDRKGKLVGISASDEFKRVGQLDLGETTHATPALSNGKMYLRTLSHLICVGKKQQNAMR